MAQTPEEKNPQDPHSTGTFPLPLKIMLYTLTIAVVFIVLKILGVF